MNWIFKEHRRRRAAQRVKPGDARPLKRFRWWQSLSRALFYLRLNDDDHQPLTYAVDVRHWGNQTSGEVKAQLYLNGRQHSTSKLPAVFPVQGGTVEVSLSGFGVKRCHYLPAGGTERQLDPDPDSAEGRRAKFERGHPSLSRVIGVLSLLILAFGLLILIPQVIAPLTLIPGIADHVGTFISPFTFPAWLNAVLAVLTAAASTERALRLRFNLLLDGGAA